jgi:hypothetical protein
MSRTDLHPAEFLVDAAGNSSAAAPSAQASG